MNDKGNASDYKTNYLLFAQALETSLPLDDSCLTL
jgi:hypothetical protein